MRSRDGAGALVDHPSESKGEARSEAHSARWARDFELPPALAAAIEAELAAGAPPGEAPGRAYERSRAGDRSGRRATGLYYTPAHLVDFVVEHTLGPALAACHEPDDALSLRVLDPACGGGFFLVAALARIEQRLAELGLLPGAALRADIATRCLRGVDLDPKAAAVARLALRLAVGGQGAPPSDELARVVEVGDALADDGPRAAARANVVIGNPPWGQKGFRFSRDEVARLRARFSTACGVLDPFKLFVERATELLSPGGRLGFVLPDIILLKDQRPVRELLLERCAIERIADAGRAFAGVNLDAVAITARRERAGAPADHRVLVWRELPPNWREAPPPEREVAQALFSELPDKKLNIHITERDMDVLRALSRSPRIGDVFEIHEGVHSGNVRAKLFRDPKPAGPCARLIVGKDEVRRYHLAWAGRYLDLDPAAIDRAAGEYANLGKRAWHESPKLAVRRTGDRIVAARDLEGLWVSNNLFVVLPRQPLSGDELAAWAGVLNARLLTWLFRTVQPRTGRLFAELKIRHLAALPAPEPAPFRRAAPAIAERVVALERAAARGDEGSERAAAIQDELDELVLDLYALPAPARRHVEAASAAGSPRIRMPV